MTTQAQALDRIELGICVASDERIHEGCQMLHESGQVPALKPVQQLVQAHVTGNKQAFDKAKATLRASLGWTRRHTP